MSRIKPRISITLPRDLHDDVAKMATEQHRSKSEQVAYLIELGIKIDAQLKEDKPSYLLAQPLAAKKKAC